MVLCDFSVDLRVILVHRGSQSKDTEDHREK